MQQAFACKGGLNTEDAVYEMAAGEAAVLFNAEVNSSGSYAFMSGCEKFDGRQEPTSATYSLVGFASVTGFTLGSVITAVPSGWSARVIGIDSSNNTVGVINQTGTLTLLDTVSSVAVTALPFAGEARSYATHKTFRAYMQDYYRGFIQAVPGVGPVRGVVIYKGDIYAFRDHSDAVTCRMYKATTGGWVEITTSGYLLKNGRYEFRIHNFKASAGTQLLIIVNGVNKAVRYDGTTCVQISTAMPTDTPSSIEVLPSSVLCLGYNNGSIMTSKVGDPDDFTIGSGGAELGMSDEIVGIALQPDERVAVFCKNSIRMITGKTASTFAISVFNADIGAIRGSITNMGDSVFVSKSGLTRLSRSQNFGAFEMSAMDKKFRSLIKQNDILFSLPVRRKNQYRLFTNAGFVGVTTIGSDVIGSFTGRYHVAMQCGYSGEINNEEYVLAGGSDGFLYRLDAGQSHAGAEYSRVIRMAHNNLRSGQQRKKFKRLVINADSDRMVPVNISAELDYSSGNAPRQAEEVAEVGGSESYLGQLVIGSAVLGAADDSINQIRLTGVGRAIAPILILNSATDDVVRMGGYSIEYEPRAKTR